MHQRNAWGHGMRLPELVNVDRQIHTAPEAAAVLVPRTRVVLGHAIYLESTVFIRTDLEYVAGWCV